MREGERKRDGKRDGKRKREREERERKPAFSPLRRPGKSKLLARRANRRSLEGVGASTDEFSLDELRTK